MYLKKVIIGCLFFCVFDLQAQTEIPSVQVQVAGELNVFTKVSSKPTSKQGQVAFLAPSSIVNFAALFDDNNFLFMELQLSANRDNLNHKFQTEMVRAFYQWMAEDSSQVVRYGLIRNFFHEAESEHFNFEFFNELNSASRRFGYLATADLGVEWQYFLSSYLSTGVGVVNGEENRKEEDGNQKDAYFLLDFNDDFFRVAFLYLRGGYDEYEKPFNLKERLILKAGYSFDFFKLGMEVFSSQDPAIGISDYKRAEGWDSTQFPETIVNARGGSLWTIISFSDRHSLMLKADYLDPYTEQKQDEINSQQVVFSYGSHSLNRFLVGYSKTSYQENHSKYSPEVEFGFAGLRRSF